MFSIKKKCQIIRTYNYSNFILKREFTAFNNGPHNGLNPGGGLKAQNLTLNDLKIETDRNNEVIFNVNADWQLLTADEIELKENQMRKAITKDPVPNVQNVSGREKERVSVQLTPTQIYKILVSPSVIDFGEVCIKTISSKNLEFVNTLDQPIYVELEVSLLVNYESQVPTAVKKKIFRIIAMSYVKQAH